jgi:hypothetical protein
MNKGRFVFARMGWKKQETCIVIERPKVLTATPQYREEQTPVQLDNKNSTYIFPYKLMSWRNR